MYRENDDGSISWFNVEDHYRWGKGFIAEDMEVNLSGGDQQHCKPGDGEYDGCDFEDQVACWFDFSDDIGEEEQQAIKDAYYEGGAGWLYDCPDHNWQEEDCYVVVLGPYKIEFCEESGTAIREVTLRTNEEQQKLREQLGEGWYIPNDSALEPEKLK
jgi:hypothetical protein